MAAKAKLDFEQAMERLREIIRLLETGEEPLERSLELFEEGAKLSAQCYETLEQAEQRVTELAAIRNDGEEKDE